MLSKIFEKLNLKHLNLILGFLLLLFLFIPQISFAAIVPESCQQGSCSPCEFFKLLSNIFNFIIAGAALFALIGLIVGAFLYMSSGSAEARITLAKNVWKNTAIGFALVVGAWLIVNTMLHLIAKDEYSKDWYTFTCTTAPLIAGGTFQGTYGTAPMGSTEFKTSADGCYGSEGFSTYSCGSNNEVTGGPCEEYNGFINKYAKENGIDPAFVKAVMITENRAQLGKKEVTADDCRVAANNITTFSNSYATGLLQVTPVVVTEDLSGDCKLIVEKKEDRDSKNPRENTGNEGYNKRRDEIAKKLQDPEFNIKCGSQALAKFFKSNLVAQNYYNLAAGWNGGYAALEKSQVCTAAYCRKWQCIYNHDDKGNKVEQTDRASYLQTREYVKILMEWYQKICPVKTTPINLSCGNQTMDCNLEKVCGKDHKLVKVSTADIKGWPVEVCTANTARDATFVMLQEAADAFNAFAREVKQELSRNETYLTIVSMYRAPGVQYCLQKSYLDKGQSGFAASPGTSNHEFGLAFDTLTYKMRDSCDYYARGGEGVQKPKNTILFNSSYQYAPRKEDWIELNIIAAKHGFRNLGVAKSFGPKTYTTSDPEVQDLLRRKPQYKAFFDQNGGQFRIGEFCAHEAWHFDYVKHPMYGKSAKEKVVYACPDYWKTVGGGTAPEKKPATTSEEEEEGD
jgi:hypothetical protein